MYCLHCKYTTKLRNDKEIDALFAISGGAVVSTAPTKQRTHSNLLCASAICGRTLAVRLVQLRQLHPLKEYSQFGWCSWGQLHPLRKYWLPRTGNAVTACLNCCYRNAVKALPRCGNSGFYSFFTLKKH